MASSACLSCVTSKLLSSTQTQPYNNASKEAFTFQFSSLNCSQLRIRSSPVKFKSNINRFSSYTSPVKVSSKQVSDNGDDLPESIKIIKENANQMLEKVGRASEELYEKTSRMTEQLLAQTDVSTAQLKEQAEKASADLLTKAEKAAIILSDKSREAAELALDTLKSVKEDIPEPIKDIAETAINSHTEEVAKKGAMIHDFCLGIPYGAGLLAGGLFWFVLAGSINALRFGAIMGSALLFLSISSLKAWKAKKSSDIYIISQGVISTLIFIAEVIRFKMTRAIFPTAITAFISAAMIGFYAYVIIAGGNPPKKASSST